MMTKMEGLALPTINTTAPCPVCKRKYAHETGCIVEKLHHDLDSKIDIAVDAYYREEGNWLSDLEVQLREPFVMDL